MTTGKTHLVILLNWSRFIKKRIPDFDPQTHLMIYFIGIKGFSVVISFY